MLGRTRLYQRTGSPLIGGSSGVRRHGWWPWLLAVVVIAAGAALYLTYLR